jgi:hypothetical protein
LKRIVQGSVYLQKFPEDLFEEEKMFRVFNVRYFTHEIMQIFMKITMFFVNETVREEKEER